MQPSRLNGRRLVALSGCIAVAVIFWNAAALEPLKLLVVMMHESGHALASLLVGGHVQRVVIATDQSGYCLSQIPTGFFNAVAVYSAGYLGSAIAGSVLLWLSFRFRLHRFVLGAIAAWLVAMAFLLAGNAFTVVFCLGAALVFGVSAAKLNEAVVEWIVLFIAAFSGLYALFDLRDDLWNGATRAHSDAALLASLTGVPSILWAGLWSLVAIALVVFAVISSVRGGPSRREVTPAMSH
jgi:hypothetical protein